MNKKTLYFGGILALLALVTACNITGPEPETSSGHEGKAAVRILIGADDIQARTVRPELALADADTWKLWGAQGTGTENLLLEFNGLTNTPDATIYLDPGTTTWNFTLDGYKAGALILSGTLTGQVISASGTTLSFEVAPVETGTGTVSITIELPHSVGITSAKVYKDGAEDPISPLLPTNNTVVFEKEYDAGSYFFSTRLYKDADLYGVISEAFHVWANLTSAKTYTMTEENLKVSYVISYHIWDGTATEYDYYQRTDAAYTLSTPPLRTGYFFRGWYEDDAFTGSPITEISSGSTGDKTFYAKWITPTDDGTTLAAQLAWVSANAAEGEAYTLTVTADGSFAPTTLSYSGKTVSITLVGDTTERTVRLNTTTGSLFTVGSGVTLTLGNNVTLQGVTSSPYNDVPLVQVDGGTLVMESGSKITRNINADINGGGVYVGSNGTFTKSGGTIYGSDGGALENSADSDTNGYAVYVLTGPKKRNTTAGESVSLDSGTGNNWE